MQPLPPDTPWLRASANLRTGWRMHWASCEGQGESLGGREGGIRPWLHRSGLSQRRCPWQRGRSHGYDHTAASRADAA